MSDSSPVVGAESEEHFSPAPLRLRFLAFAMDYSIISVLFFSVPEPVPYLLFPLLFVVYHTIFIWPLGKTPAKAVLGLKVVRVQGSRSLLWSLGRCALGYPVANLFGLGALAAIAHSSRRCGHDWVFGSVVALEPERLVGLRSRIDALVQFFERHREAAAQRTKPVAALLALFVFLRGLASTLSSITSFFSAPARAAGRPDSALSAVSLLSTKAATLITAGLSIVVGSVVFTVPEVRVTAEWLIAPRHFVTAPPAGWVRCTCPARHAGAGAFYRFERWHANGIWCKDAIFSR